MGALTYLFTWPMFIVLHYTGLEVFELPSSHVAVGLLINMTLDVTLNVALVVGIGFTSPLFMAVGAVLTMPISITADWLVNDYIMPMGAFFGVGGIVAGFILLNVAEYLIQRKKKRQSVSVQHLH